MFDWQSLARRFVSAGVLVSCLGAVTGSEVAASVWVSPLHPLSDADRMEVAVTSAEAVVIASVDSVGMLTLGEEDPYDGAGWRWMNVTVERWLKGGAEQSDKLRVYFSDFSSSGFSQVTQWSQRSELPIRSLMFIHPYKSQDGQRWALNEHPDFPGNGLVRLAAKMGERPAGSGSAALASAQMVESAERAIRESAIEEVAKRSPVVVVGVVKSGAGRLAFQGRSLKCTGLLVDEVLAGDVVPGTLLSIYGRYGGLGAEGRALLMLKPGEGNAFELVGSGGGVVDIRDGRNERTGEDARKLFARIRKLKRAQTETGGGR